MTPPNDTLTQIARLWLAGKLVRHDGEHEQHYPNRRKRFVRMVEDRARKLAGATER